MTADDIIAGARECLETPFRHQARLVGVGLDCAGVVAHAVRSVGCEVIEVAGYGRTPNNGLLEQALDGQSCVERITDVSDRRPGDILLMRFTSEPQHLAIFTGETIVHAYEAVGKCCEHRLSSVWAARIVRVYRVKGLS